MELLIIAIAGLLSTSAMIGAMALIHRMKWANADMVRAIGSIFSRSFEGSLIPGLIIQYSGGLIFSFGYALLIGYAPVQSAGIAVIIAGFAGLVHGILVGLTLEVLVAEHHPLVRFRKVGFGVVVAHVVGHLVYGLTLGILFALSWKQIHNIIENFVQGGSLGEFVGFAVIWLPVFGIPIVYAGYIIYRYWVSEFRQETEELDHKKEDKESHSNSGNAA